MTETNADFSKRARAVCDAATEGPWQTDAAWDANVEASVVFSESLPVAHARYLGGTTFAKRNADFIALARTALPEALDRLADADKKIADLATEYNDLVGERNQAQDERDRLRGEVERLRKRRSHGGSISRGALGHDR